MAAVPKISPCLWFDGQAEEAANFYVSVFKGGSKVANVMRYGEAGREQHGGKPGSVLAVTFELNGQPFMALNGGPEFTFSEAISFQVPCETQEEIDYYWERLLEGGQPSQCGWLKDTFGVSWQVFPRGLPEMIGDPTSAASQRAMTAMMGMVKLDLAALKRAFAGDR
jgi:predicted 3-demethylubiquinone-9 3-methyltransferase (glyoxalase superfamily)